MSRFGAAVETALAEERAAHVAVGDFTKELKERRQAEFDAAGGCERCRGRGWIVTWDTLDSLSGCYAEFGGCPEDHDNGIFLNHAVYNKYDRNRGVEVTLAHTDEEVAEQDRRMGALKAAKKVAEQARADAAPMRGKAVRVVRGRKVAKGIEGEIFWVGPDRYGNGDRVGLKTTEGEKYFTAAKNVEVI